MLYHLLYPLRDWWFGFNVFKYITFRAAMASVTAFLLTLLIAPSMIRWLKALKVGESVRRQEEVKDLFELHRHKGGTPTMGGLLILAALIGSTVLWGDLFNLKLLLALGLTAALGGLGFLDDLAKLKQGRGKEVTARSKLFWQGAAAVFFIVVLLGDLSYSTVLEVPFFKEPLWNLGLGYIPLALLVVVGASNAVNLADGLDGLAVGCTIMIALCLTVMSYLAGHRILADYLWISYVPGAGELCVFCAALAGAGMGFLWYNAHPATIFMGDTGSLALGGAIGAVAVLIKKELLLGLLGGIFVMEVLSVILQVASFRMTGNRIFLMAPIHHHFQLKGWPENKVTVRFWILGAVLALLSLSTLKLR
ncbi:MAG: phospho-N-acetylmuramoyl-pentapeptide-transferase [Candidatus Omnitrophica bacterium]|nr:phospho-N-acetylmuramoyl-pentapeptide-transferase [Candidatus Omnitrophota bacterium]